MKCLDCGATEGTMLKEFDNEKSYYWSEIAEMTEICACCGSELVDFSDEINLIDNK